MSYVFWLQERHRYAGWSETRQVTTVDGSVEELVGRLHDWAVEVIGKDVTGDGEYWAQLVDVGDHGDVHCGTQIEIIDVYWFGGEEYVPASSVPA